MLIWTSDIASQMTTKWSSMDVNAIYNVKYWPKAHLYAQVNFVRLQSSEMSRTQFLII